MSSPRKKDTPSRLYENRYVIGAFFLSAAIILLTFAVRRIYPFGDRTVLRVDLYHQYAPYIEELHSRILHGKSLLYSWEGGLGKNFVAQMAYYTTSPVNLLMFLFPEKHLPEMIALFILLKMSFASATFTWYLKDRFTRNDLSVMTFGLLYGFCAFLTCYYWNIMWLDTVVLFPLVMRGVEKLVREGRFRLYYISLTLTMIVNFYLAVLVCVLTALYYAATVFSSLSWRTDRALMLKRSGLFALLSILAAVTSLFILAPVGVALGETAVSSTSFPAFEVYPNVWQLITNHFLGARAAVLARNEDLPNVYTGVLTMVLLPLYYFSKDVKRREKILLSILLVFMLLCACIRPLDYLIHGMHFPANLPHRFTFAYSFILLYMAYQAYLSLEHTRFLPALIACAVYTAVILLTEFVAVGRIEDIDRVLSNADIAANIILMAAYLILLYVMRRRRLIQIRVLEQEKARQAALQKAQSGSARSGKKADRNKRQTKSKNAAVSSQLKSGNNTESSHLNPAANAGSSLLNPATNAGSSHLNPATNTGSIPAATVMRSPVSVFLSLILLAYVLAECAFMDITNLEDTGSRDAYIKYMDDAPLAVAYMDEQQQGAFYRTEFRRFTTINDASLYHYNGFSQFSSLEPGGISQFMQDLGIAATGNSFRYYDPTPLIDAMFNLRYVMNKDGAHPKEEKYRFEKQFGTVWVYSNDRVLPLAFLTDKALMDWQTGDSHPFAVQNDFIHKAAGVEEDMFTLLDADSIETENITVKPIDGKENHFNYELPEPGNLSKEPTVSAVYTSDRDQYLYLYVDAGNAQRFVYKNNSVNEDRELSAGRSLIDVGHVSAGEKIYVDFKLTKRGAFEKTYRESGTVSLYAASYDDTVFQKGYEILNRRGYEISDFTDTRITGTVHADQEQLLFTSIPWTRGWEVRLDGEKTDKVSIGDDGVIGVLVPEGEHEIVFAYHEKVLLPAVLLSIAGLAVFILLVRKKK